MERISRMWRSGLAMILALCMIISACPVTAFAADGDDTLSYVALGASNTNGFGLMGYLPENLYNNPVNKMTGSVYGYQMEPEQAYPALVKNALAEMTGKNVELEQLAISSMRAEELHVLLDNEYYGDKYTQWRFTGGQNWFNMANPGGLDGLRAEYQEFVKNADVITVDIGANNFGVYASNRIFNNMFDADFTRFDEGTQRDVAKVKAEINKLLNEYVAGALTPELSGMFDHIVDTMTYAVVGFCVNFDASMKRIYELNPDATVVVVNIQNLMHDLYATLPCMDQPIPFGDFYGAIVNLANVYVASMSPYADKYSYAYIGTDGQAETFLKDIQDYTGNPADLRTAVTDCFDVYDNDMYAKTQVLQALAKLYLPTGQVTLKDGYTKYGLADLENLNKFSDAVYDNAILFGGVPVQDFLSYGAANGLPGELQSVYDQYAASLLTVYDTAATLMQLGANSSSMDLAAAAANFSTTGKTVLQQFFAMLIASMQNPGLKIEETPEFQALANDPTAMAIITLGVRSDLGNSFFSHPNENGHVQIKNAICTALKEEIKGKDVVIKHTLPVLKDFLDKMDPESNAALLDKVNLGNAITAHVKLDEKSVYVALGDGSAEKDGYVELLGNKLAADYGVKTVYNYAAVGNTVATELAEAATRKGIADASLITIGFGNVTMLHNAINNAGVVNYDWAELVGDDKLPVVQEALDAVFASIADTGLDEALTMQLNAIVEGFAYSAVEYALKLPELVDEIRSVNDDAVIAVVGQYNPMDGVVLDMGGTTMDMSEYIDSLVDAVTLHGIGYAAITGEFIFVEAPAVEISNTNKVWTKSNLLYAIINGFKDLYPSANGDQYIANRILNALKINQAKPTSAFADVAEGTYYYDAVVWAVEKGITNGYGSPDIFAPDVACNRGQIVTFIWRAAGCPAPKSSENPFKDVADDQFYTEAVLWAVENGITKGYGAEDVFAPDVICNRAQIVTLLNRYLGGAASSNNNPFEDVPAGEYYTDAVLWAAEKGITTGTSATTFEPEANCTRGQIVTFLYRALYQHR